MAESAKLDILMGPAGSGKTAAALDAYREILHAGSISQRRRTLWLAPTQAAASDVRDVIVGEAPDAFLDPGVTTFAGFASEVVWDAGLRVRVVSPLERRRVLRRVIADAAANGALAYFGRVAESGGLLNLVGEAIASLKRRDVSAESFRKATRRASERQRELAELYLCYEERLSLGKLLDAEGLFLAARDGIRSAPAVATGLQLVVADGFTDFTPAQLQILEIIAQRARRVVVTLVGENENREQGQGAAGMLRRDLFAKTLSTRAALERLGAVLLLSDPSPRASAHAWPAMAHLERNLFRNYAEIEELSPAARQSLARIEVVGASGVQAEIEEIARRVKQLLVQGAPPAEIVVAFRSTHDVADRVRRAFDDFGIPTHLDVPRRLTATPLVRSLLAILRLHAEDWPYRRVLQVVGDRSLSMFDQASALTQWPALAQWPAEGAAAGADARTAAESCVRHAQLAAGRREFLEQVAVWAADESGLGVVDAGVASCADVLLRNLAKALDELPERGALENWIGAVEQVATTLGLISDAASSGQAMAVWTALARGLRAMERVDRSTGIAAAELSIHEFLELAGTAVTELAAPDYRDATGRVRVLSAEAARFVRPRHLFVGGLSEQAFPAGRRAEEAAPEAQVSEQSDDGRGDEMLLFYQLVTRPSETLTLSYPALDAKAQPMPPSPFLVELRRAFRDELKEHKQSLGYQAHDEGPALSRSDLRRRAVADAQDRKRELLAALVRSPRYGPLGQSLLDGIETVASRGDRRAFGAFEGLFASDEARAILERKFGPDHLWSPSALETYAACPFRFFGEHILKLAPAPEMVLESDMARRGSVLHDTLARLYARLNAAAEEGGPAIPAELVAQRFQETLDAIVHSRPRRGLDGALREIERRQIAAWAEKFAEQHEAYGAAWQQLDAPLVPRYFEARFGPKHRRSESVDDASLSTDKPFALIVGKEQFQFTGQIDRIDVGRVGETMVFNVIDYKTSAQARVKQEHIEAGTQIQLPLYAMAAAELLLADKQAAALTAGYWSIRGKGFGAGARSGGPLAIGEIRDGKVELAAGWSQLRETLLARIAEIVGGIRHGAFPVFNEDKNCGQFCPLSTGCRITHIRSLEKNWPAAKTVGGVSDADSA